MNPAAPAKRIDFTVTGLHCAGCAGTAQRALAAVPGVRSASVKIEGGAASVELEDGFSDFAALDAAVRDSGYATDLIARVADEVCALQTPVTPLSPAEIDSTPEIKIEPPPAAPAAPGAREVRLRLDGMTCASCVAKIEKALKKTPGVEAAEVNFATHRARVFVRPETADAALIEAVKGAGYGAEPITEEDDGDPARAYEEERKRSEREVLQWRTHFLAAGAASIVLMLSGPLHLLVWAHAAIATAIQAWVGARFYRGAGRALRARAANMDTLIALGTTAAWGNGFWQLAQGTHHASHEFMTATMLLAFISLGKWLEGRGRINAGKALRALLELAPAKAHLVLQAGEVVEVESRSLRPGDRCRVWPGERLPADGKLLDHDAEVNESMLTGEPLPAVKKPGAPLFGGTVNAGGALTLFVEKVGAATALRQIARRVEEAQNTRPKMQALADAVSAWFVPAVLVIAALTVAASVALGVETAEAVSRAVAILVVACPCALGLATPLAVMAGVGVAARRGMIVRSAAALEVSGSLTAVAFDKTGTLTVGKPEVTGVYPSPGHDENEVLSAAAWLEAENSHPIAQAIRAAARARGLAIKPKGKVKSLVGQGLKSKEPPLVLGSDLFLKASGVKFEGYDAKVAKRQKSGETIVALGVPGGDYIGAIALADRIKPGAPRAIQELRALGLKTILISGDSEPATQAVAQLLAIDDFRARVAPASKADAIKALQDRGERVAMAGDGINDAPALAQADLGIAMAAGSDIAQQAAGIVLLSGDPAQAATAIKLARAIRRNMIQNLAWAFAYNTALIPLAAFGYLQPIYASAAMAVSSLTVVGNALLLYRWKG